MNTFIIAGSYSNQDVLEAIYPTCLYSLLIMSIPLFLFLYSKKASKISLLILVYIFLPFHLLVSSLSMCPHYSEFIFTFFAWIPLLVAAFLLKKELEIKKHFMLYILIWLTFMSSVKVPFDINRALKGQMKGAINPPNKLIVGQQDLP